MKYVVIYEKLDKYNSHCTYDRAKHRTYYHNLSLFTKCSQSFSLQQAVLVGFITLK